MRELVEGKNTIGRTATVLKKPYKATFTPLPFTPVPLQYLPTQTSRETDPDRTRASAVRGRYSCMKNNENQLNNVYKDLPYLTVNTQCPISKSAFIIV